MTVNGPLVEVSLLEYLTNYNFVKGTAGSQQSKEAASLTTNTPPVTSSFLSPDLLTNVPHVTICPLGFTEHCARLTFIRRTQIVINFI